MNIALVVHDLHNHGGHSLYTRILADGLSSRHKVTVFANRCERPPDAEWQQQRVRAWRGSALACVQTFPLGMRAQADALNKYEIRHTQGYCGGQPNTVTAHICVAAYVDSLRRPSMRHRVSLKLMAAAESRFYQRYEGKVIAISRKVANELREYYGVQRPIKIIPHGVDVARFNNGNRSRDRRTIRAELGIGNDDTLALYVGDLTKSHSHLKELSESAPAVHFAIATYSRAYRWNRRNVHFLPPTSELHRYYATADAFVFPTTYDAFGMVVLEAMASGLPVFVSDRAGAAELIENGKDGFVLPLSHWVQETSRLLSNRSLGQRVGLSAARTARRHDWASVVSAVERVYGEVVSA